MKNLSNGIFSAMHELAGTAAKIFMKAGVFLMDIPFLTFSGKLSPLEKEKIGTLIEQGDIVMTSDCLFPLWRLAVKVAGNSNFGHAALYEGDGNLIEATTFHPSGMGVARTAVEDYVAGYKKICVIRPPYHSREQRDNAVNFAVAQLGKPYDYMMKSESDQTMYCTKLVALALAMGGCEIGGQRFMGYWFSFPDDFLNASGVEIIYGKNYMSGSLILSFLSSAVFVAVELGLLCVLLSGALSAGRYAILSFAVFALCIVAGLWQLKIKISPKFLWRHKMISRSFPDSSTKAVSH